MNIGLDINGGDFAPEVNVLGALRAKKELPENAKIVLIGNEPEAIKILKREGVSPSLFDFMHTEDAIGMGEHPVKAFMKKQNSSIALGFKALATKKIDAFASTGNTGAMLVGSMQTIKAIPGVIRPCISSVLPQLDGSSSILLDVGTNADCKADVLYQFGILGSIFAKEIHAIDNPRVSLLNIGEEEEKGNLLTKASYTMMKDSPNFNFQGNIEGGDLFNNSTDVIVCDGFTGNVVLKEAEALYSLVKTRGIKDEFFERFNYEDYGGTPILGVNSNVLIGHGKSTEAAVSKMLTLAAKVVEADLPAKIEQKIREAFI